MNLTFFIWLLVAIIQITLFSFYLGKMSTIKKKETIEKTVDIFPICNYNGQMYWIEDKELYREDIKSPTMDKDKAEKVDQLDSKDLSPSEIIYIINMLEDAQ